MAAALIERRRPAPLRVACLDLDWRPAFRVELVPSYKAHRVAPRRRRGDPRHARAAGAAAARGADRVRAGRAPAPRGSRPTTSSPPWPPATRTPSRSSPATATCSRWPPTASPCSTPARGIAKMEAMGPAEVRAKYGVPAAHYADFAVLRGDPSDGLPGVPGRRREDRRRAGRPVRRGRGRSSRRPRRGDDGFPAGAAAKVLAARRLPRLAPGAPCAGAPTRRSTRSTTRCRSTPRDPDAAGRAGRRTGPRQLGRAADAPRSRPRWAEPAAGQPLLGSD